MECISGPPRFIATNVAILGGTVYHSFQHAHFAKQSLALPSEWFCHLVVLNLQLSAT